MIKGLLLLFVLSFTFQVSAKKELPIEKDSPPSETEIICFAALEKWVCAPASDRQQAQDKAMRLVDEQAQKNAVVIQTIPADQQWQQVVVEETTAETAIQNASKQSQSESAGEAEIQPAEVHTQEQVVKQATAPVAQKSEPSQSQSQHFSGWKTNHSKAWTLQAVGTTNLPNLEGFINQNQLSSETMAIATTEVKGAPWHIVLVGIFESREQALAYKSQAVDQGASWAAQAWPRPIAGIDSVE